MEDISIESELKAIVDIVGQFKNAKGFYLTIFLTSDLGRCVKEITETMGQLNGAVIPWPTRDLNRAVELYKAISHRYGSGLGKIEQLDMSKLNANAPTFVVVYRQPVIPKERKFKIPDALLNNE